MARSLIGAVAYLSESIAFFANRRGYAAAAAAVGSRIEHKAAVRQVVDSSSTAISAAYSSASSNSWVPDPVTGYYRPGNLRQQVDAAELRNALLSHKH